MISSVSFHPFISHFPIALFIAGLGLLILSRKKDNPLYQSAAAFNFSMGFIAALMADFSGMVSVDVGLRTTVEVEGHQGYSFLFTIFYGFITVYSYTKAFSRTAYIYYGLSFLAMCACAISGYSLVFK